MPQTGLKIKMLAELVSSEASVLDLMMAILLSQNGHLLYMYASEVFVCYQGSSYKKTSQIK
jgi:hypothetical protein